MGRQLRISLMRVILLCAVVLVVTVLAGCAKEEAPKQPFSGEKLKITASNFKFNEKEYQIKAGQATEISFASLEGVHAIKVDGTDISLDDGDSEVVTLNAGEYKIVCTIPCGSGHSEMVSKLIVS